MISTAEAQRRYRGTPVGREKARVQTRAQGYALRMLKLAHREEYDKHRLDYLAAHPYPEGVGSGHRIDYGGALSDY